MPVTEPPRGTKQPHDDPGLHLESDRPDLGEIPIREAFLWSLIGHVILGALLFLTTMAISVFTVKTIVEKVKDQKTTEAKRKVIEFEIEEAKEDQPKPETQFQFMEVDPNLASEEPPPEETKMQSMANTRAANLAPQLDTEIPNIEGSQKDVIRTVNQPKPVSLPPAVPVQPKDPVTPPAREEVPQAPVFQQPKTPSTKETPPQEEAVAKEEPMPLKPLPEKPVVSEAKPTSDPGNTPAPQPVPEMSMPRPSQKVAMEPKEANIPEKAEPHRSLMEAKIKSQISPGEAMEQEGGSRTIGVDSMDAVGTAAGVYFDMAIKAMKKRWFDLIEERNVGITRAGYVVIHFNIYQDGRVGKVKVAESTVGDSIMEYICIGAISDPAPYGPWPAEMKSEIGRDYKFVSFRFTYR